MLTIDDLSIKYKDKVILKRLDLELQQGDIFALLGDSGSGKSSALRFVAGLDEAVSGRVVLDDVLLSDGGQHNISAENRSVGMVFQDYALFPHMSVEKNIAFGIDSQPKSEQRARIQELLSLIDLEGIEKKYPHQLSGGEQQRVALARALAPAPKLLLLDEPFSNLDKTHRDNLVAQVRAILKKTNTTSILVTHDKAEAHTFADVIGEIKHQQLQTIGVEK
ncbi:Ferric iron ABC transporter, ATP-binding protein [uncultured Candidatus Thioglobus sp.]|nr:Ferric iron ABC transporter, ATP-binding protein [uncultured Candidatus Thioglobus sp.]